MRFIYLLTCLLSVSFCSIYSHKDYSFDETYGVVCQCYNKDINKISHKELVHLLDSVDSTFCKTCIEGGEMFNEIIFNLLLNNTSMLLKTLKQEELSGKNEKISLIIFEVKQPLADVGVFSEDNICAMIQNVAQTNIRLDCKTEIISSLYEAMGIIAHL